MERLMNSMVSHFTEEKAWTYGGDKGLKLHRIDSKTAQPESLQLSETAGIKNVEWLAIELPTKKRKRKTVITSQRKNKQSIPLTNKTGERIVATSHLHAY